MSWKIIQVLFWGVLVTVSVGLAQPANQTDPLYEFKKRAARFNSVISLPQFEITTNEVRDSVQQTIAAGKGALDTIGALKPGKVTFEKTIRALDDVGYQVSLTDSRLSLIMETSTNAALRDAATDAIKELEEWSIGLEYREDVYKAVKAYAGTKPRLRGEDAKLLKETVRDYRRAGWELPKAQRDEVERM